MMARRSRTACIVVTAAVLLVTGCSTRSISNSGYPGDHATRNPLYAGELRDSDVIGPVGDGPIDDALIADALASAHRLALKPGQKLMVIQSGALAPDQPMVEALAPRFDVGAMSGIPTGWGSGGVATSRLLRLTAARGGYPTIFCYWGTLEAAQEAQVTKAVSWVPIAGWMVPDESQRMRISLKAVLVDVATGRWSMIMPDSFEDASLSALISRRSVDQGQVDTLKRQAYEALARRIALLAQP